MKNKLYKKPLICGIILAVLLSGCAKAPDARALLEKAESMQTQNLCLLALLEQDPGNAADWQRLIGNYEAEGADALTLFSAREAAGLEPGSAAQKEPVVPRPETAAPGSGLCAGASLLTAFPEANAIAGSDALYYRAETEALLVCYRGLVRRLLPVRADRLLPVENGLYFRNVTTRRVQYTAADGSVTRTVSPVEAADYAFYEGRLYIAGTDGVLYIDGVPAEMPAGVTRLAVADRLYAACAEGLWCVNGEVQPLRTRQLTGGDGKLWYLTEAGYPACYDPETAQAAVLKETAAEAIARHAGAVYIYTNGKIKKL